MKFFCGLMLGFPLLVLSAPQDIIWTAEKLMIAGQRSRLPFQPPWPAQQSDLVGYGMTGAVPKGVECTLELKLRDELLRSFPCSKAKVLEQPVRVTPGMRLELYLHNTDLFSPGEEIVLRNRISLEVAK